MEIIKSSDDKTVFEQQREQIAKLFAQSQEQLEAVQQEHARIANAYNYVMGRADVEALTITKKE